MSRTTKIILLFIAGIIAGCVFFFLREHIETSRLTNRHNFHKGTLFVILVYFLYVFLLAATVLLPFFGISMIFFKHTKWFKKLMQ
jgi:uncharacterized membrane-anchored protein